MRFYFIAFFGIATQLYSNLVNYMNSTIYLCLVLAVLCSLVVSRILLALAAHSFTSSSYSQLKPSLASIPFLLITEDKGGPTHGQKTKS